jgi:hypothetical protein
MPDLKFAVWFTAIDNLSSKFGDIGAAAERFMDGITSGSEKISDIGERMKAWGERIGITTAILSEGANMMHEWAGAIREPAMGMEHSMATMAAMTGMASDKLGEIKNRAIEFSNTHPGVTAEQVADSFTRFSGVFTKTDEAMRASQIAGMLQRFGVDGTAAFNLLTVANRNFNMGAQQTGDQLMGAFQAFRLTGERAQQLAQAIGLMGGAAQETHTPLSELLALTGVASEQLGGSGRGATRFAGAINEMVASGKTGIDFSHGITAGLHQLASQIANMPSAEKIATLKGMGTPNPEMMVQFLEHLDQVQLKLRAIGNSPGLEKAFGTATADVQDQTALLHQNMASLADAFATPALGFMNAGLTTLIGVTKAATDVTEHHNLVAKAVSISLMSIGDGAYYGLKGLSAMGTFAAGLGKSIDLIGKFGDAETWALRGMYAWDHVTAIAGSISNFASYANLAAGATKLWTAAQWLLNLAMDANPIGLAIAGIATLAVAAYEIYEHWGAIKNFFKGIWDYIANIDWKGLGITILKSIGEGLLYASGLTAIYAASSKVAGIIMDHLKGHSPPPLGPLHELGRINIIETIAERMNPGPVIAAVRRTAAAIAIAAPMMMAAPAMAMASPMMIGAAAPAFAGSSASAARAGIVINAPVTVTVGAGADKDAIEKIVVRAFTQHRYELVRAMQGELAKRERTKLS